MNATSPRGLLRSRLYTGIATASRLGANDTSKVSNDGPIPSGAATPIYIDDATGREVSEDWWPTITEQA